MNRRMGQCALLVAAVIGSSACDIFGTGVDAENREVRVPSGWNVFNFTGGPYSYGLDRAAKHGGTASAFIHGDSLTTQKVVSLVQDMRPDNYRGKRIRWSGWVRSRGVASQKGTGGVLWANVYDVQATWVAGTSPILGTSAWHEVSVVLDVPETALGIRIGVLLQGAGDLLIDDFKLQPVGTDVMATGSAASPPDSGPYNLLLYYQQQAFEPANLDFEGSASTLSP